MQRLRSDCRAAARQKEFFQKTRLCLNVNFPIPQFYMCIEARLKSQRRTGRACEKRRTAGWRGTAKGKGGAATRLIALVCQLMIPVISRSLSLFLVPPSLKLWFPLATD